MVTTKRAPPPGAGSAMIVHCVSGTWSSNITVGLPATAGQDVADKYCKVSFDVAAEQQH